MVGQRASILQVSARTGPGRGSVSGYDVIYNEDWALQILARTPARIITAARVHMRVIFSCRGTRGKVMRSGGNTGGNM